MGVSTLESRPFTIQCRLMCRRETLLLTAVLWALALAALPAPSPAQDDPPASEAEEPPPRRPATAPT